MAPQDEKQAFATRLQLALKRAPKAIRTPTELALQFNLKHPNDPISPQAAQKWMTGKATPTADKLATLAALLRVSPLWLRHGIADKRETVKSKAKTTLGSGETKLTASEIQLLERLRALPESRRRLVEDLVEQFWLDQEMWSQ